MCVCVCTAAHARRYGLMALHSVKLASDLPASFPIKEEMAAFLSWAGTPIQLDRDSKSVSSTTRADYVKCVSQYLGWVYTKQNQLKPQNMSLRMFTNQAYWFGWMGYCQARCGNIQHIINLISKTRAVLRYLLSKDGPGDEKKVWWYMCMLYSSTFTNATESMHHACDNTKANHVCTATRSHSAQAEHLRTLSEHYGK